MLQQYLPFTLLKRINVYTSCIRGLDVATVLTVYAIETSWSNYIAFTRTIVATVLTVYAIETLLLFWIVGCLISFVATVLTVYGIET